MYVKLFSSPDPPIVKQLIYTDFPKFDIMALFDVF